MKPREKRNKNGGAMKHWRDIGSHGTQGRGEKPCDTREEEGIIGHGW